MASWARDTGPQGINIATILRGTRYMIGLKQKLLILCYDSRAVAFWSATVFNGGMSFKLVAGLSIQIAV